MKKHRIRPPRTPKGESAETTICIQHNEIVFLTNRVADLVAERDELLKKFYDQDQLQVMIAGQERRINILVDRIDGMARREIELMSDRNREHDKYAGAVDELSAIKTELMEKEAEILEMENVVLRLQGFQDCAREIIATLGPK